MSVLHVAQRDLHLFISRVAAIAPLSHLIEVGTLLALSEVIACTDEQSLPLKFVLSVSTVLL